MADRPNIVWLTIESTRADHTSLHGYERETTPNLRRIADDAAGRAFSQCFSHGVWTLPSSASILTGTFPSHHGAGMGREAIPEPLPTVPERFSEQGYRTAGVSTNFHASGVTDLDRGFDRFGWLSKDTILDVAGYRTLGKYLRNIRTHSAGLTADVSKHSTGYVVTDVLKRWLREFTDDQPFFLYAHYGDPHHEYYPPLPYHDRFLEDISVERAREAVDTHHSDLNELIANGCEIDDEAWAAIKAMYDAEIAYTDALIGQVFDYVRERFPNTVFVITADHGELFGEQEMLAHKVVVDDAVTHVPLVVHGMPAIADHPGELVQHVDIIRTLLGEIDHSSSQLQGVDLRDTQRPFAVVQRGGDRTRKNIEKFRELNPEFDTERYHDGHLHALRTQTYKYLRSDDREELYRLPDETNDVSDDDPEMVTELREQLDRWLEATGEPAAAGDQQRNYSGAVKRQMKDLGYLE